MINKFFQNLAIPVLLIIDVMAYLGLSEVLLNCIDKKRYVPAGILAVVVTGIFGPKVAIIEAIIVVGRIIYRKHKLSREP